MNKVVSYIEALRPTQWTKNLVVLAGVVFSRNALVPDLALRSLRAFAIFCLLAGSIYVFNDLADLERDRVHPTKSKRPIASGRVSRSGALALGTVTAVGGLLAARTLGSSFFASAIVYFVLISLYTMGLKHVVILDVMIISIGFVLRAIAGVEALKPVDPTVLISPWLLVCTLFLALFLGFNKRRNELQLLAEGAGSHRKSLLEYSGEFLDATIAVATAATVIAYAIYTIWPGTIEKFHTPNLIYTVPFVVFGLFRYMYLAIVKNRAGSPSEVLLSDLPIALDIILWLVVVGLVLYRS
ncbi:MAG TPA: decaprenyl-phosphate phosphoribosyltransferase [bacterium]|nr:decaprenyl-phosphate phosphoribosyltransferase [bacterium]